MSKQNKKYMQVIRTARELFWKYGIRRVTVEEICNEANVSKMTFYKFFSNKNDLVRHIIDSIFDDSMQRYRNIMDSHRTYKKKVTDLAILKMEATNDISHEFLNDYYTLVDDDLSGYLHKKVNENINAMLQDFIIAQEKGEIRQDIKPEFIMYFLNHLASMANDKQLSSLYPNAQDMIMEMMNFFFYGILPRDDKE